MNIAVESRGDVAPVLGISPATVSTPPVVWISPVVTTEFDGGGDVAPVVGISPAETVPESTHARTSANPKCLMLSLFSFELRNASQLARKHDSVNTYRAIDT